MAQRIANDVARFRQIVRGTIRRELKNYIARGELIGRKGRDLVSIPVPHIDLPRFRFGGASEGGVGQGPGEEGTPIGVGEPGLGPAGSEPGDHLLEVEVTLEDLARLLGEELELPNIESRGKQNIVNEVTRYTGIRPVGPESLRHFKRTYRQALRRQLISGTYQPEAPQVVPVREDRRYRSWKVSPLPESNAVILYMMDVSGSMGDEQKELVRLTAFWIDTWLRTQYRDVDTIYLIHDAEAREVDEHTFYHTRESGGTRISSAYRLARDVIGARYPPADWNLYLFHFSDGDNWEEDTPESLDLLSESLLPQVNLFCYGQVHSAWGGAHFLDDLRERLGEQDTLVTAEIAGREHVLAALRAFLGKGR